MNIILCCNNIAYWTKYSYSIFDKTVSLDWILGPGTASCYANVVQ